MCENIPIHICGGTVNKFHIVREHKNSEILFLLPL